MNDTRVESLWLSEGLKAPVRQPNRALRCLNNGACPLPRPEQRDHVLSYFVVNRRTPYGRAFRMLNDLGEFTREWLAIRMQRRFSSTDAVEVLADLILPRAIPA